jgi:membrane-anchored protein YejM (alkaline phosphatase superfamily)
MGAWFSYGLGADSHDLPGFVVLNGGLIPPGGLDCFNSGFLPATYQGSVLNPGQELVANIHPSEKIKHLQRKKMAMLGQLDSETLARIGHNDQIESAIANYELAFQMQTSIPGLADLSGESSATHEMYGLNSSNKKQATYGQQCLLARRLLERGVRFIELTCPNIGHDRWDQHSNLKKGHWDNAKIVDQAIGALLTDLKQRGMLDETLVVWSGEFGRTPFAQGKDGRDHNPFGFSLWLAGGGVQGGVIHGATDEFGYKAVANRQEIHDLHATMLHLLGIDHKRLTYRWSGRDMRLTDVHGKVIQQILS